MNRSGWLSAQHCDPYGARVAIVVEALTENAHIKALFWE